MRDDRRMDVTFRALVDDDLPMLHAWLNDPDVVRWWEGDDVTWTGVVADYGEATRGAEDHYVAVFEGRSIGWIQCGDVREWEDEHAAWTAAGADASIGGIDYLLGVSDDRHRGLGSAMIHAFVHDVVFPTHPGWTQVGADPAVANGASWGALAKAGFRHLADIDGKEGPGRLMVLDRPSG